MRIPALILALGAIASAQTLTTVSDTVYLPSGNGLFQGRIILSTDTAFEFNSQTYTRAWRASVQVNNGIFYVQLPPNDATLPQGTSYIAEFEPASGSGYSERWVVPTSVDAVTIAQVRTSVLTVPGRPISPMQISRSGASVGQLLVWNGTSWQPAGATSIQPLTLDQLVDVDATAATAGQYLRFDGADWIGAAITQADVTGLISALAGKAASVHLHAIADVTGLQATLDGKAPTVHAHAISDTTGLQAALDGKAALSHIHTIANITGLQTALDAKSALGHTHSISDTTGLQAAIDAKAALVHVHTIADTTGLQAALDSKAAASHAHAQSDVTGLVSALAGKSAIGHVHLISDISTLQAMLDAKAPLISPALTGTPTAPTQSLSDNSTALATTAWVKSQGYGTGGGGAADLNGLSDVTITSPANGQLLRYNGSGWENAAAQLADVTGLVSALAGKAASVHGHVITDVTGLQSALDGKAALTHVHAIADTTGLSAALAALAPLASAALTGTPTAPTPLTADDSTKIATTAWVRLQGYGSGGGGATNLDGLTDVIITSPASGQTLRYNGSTWVNAAIAQADVTGLVSALGLLAPLASPALTGAPTATTPATLDDSTRIATTAWVRLQGYGSGGGGSSSPAFPKTITSQTTVTVTAVEHGMGNNPFAYCLNNETPRVHVNPGASVSLTGTLTLSFLPAFTGTCYISPLSVGGGSGSSFYQTIRTDGGTNLTQRQRINLISGPGVAVTAADDAGNTETDITISVIPDVVTLNGVQTLAEKTLISPALTGTPTATTAATLDNSTRIATTAWVRAQGYSTSGGSSNLDGLTDVAITSPATAQVLRYDGTNWLNAAIAQADVTGLVSALAGKAASVHGHVITDVTGLQSALDAKAPLASPALTGTPTAPTPAMGSNDTSLATTEFVLKRNMRPELGWNCADEFIGTALSSSTPTGSCGHNTVISGTGAAVTLITGEAAAPGIAQAGTGTTSTGISAIITRNANFIFGGGASYSMAARVRVPTLSDGTEAFSVQNGFLDANGSAIIDGCYLSYSHAANGGRWQENCVANSVATTADTGVTVAANIWYSTRVEINAAGNSAEFFIDGVSVGVINTNVPSGTGRQTGTGFSIAKSAGTTSRTADVDYMAIQIKR